jgi:hypothetical protein
MGYVSVLPTRRGRTEDARGGRDFAEAAVCFGAAGLCPRVIGPAYGGTPSTKDEVVVFIEVEPHRIYTYDRRAEVAP